MEQQFQGSCHCQKVQFEFQGPLELEVIRCHCSICKMKQNHHVLIDNSKFKLLTSMEELTLYTFNTKQAKHYFCKTCGVQAFFYPRFNPNMIAVTIYCVQLPNNVKLTYVTQGLEQQIKETIQQ
ncbi:unnamed protein product (macronuclear) [Paramecium tetraurelia]|uniref:CENP-V/GFA domain-containing protein n=1 Tax=Paramecium tetraurelia TaxID=5888 RepID=A0CSE9_PARTE|nr:uncharacterized protein GSPATT00009988001 [Paramecium tetraurelia]CAK73716.1 unnamed protein product [Paramecium tetraurelia]|eukprot:XP_001441113.1 hypothetical protein (macronuclear) [Paramecium tetraurelia strain d4-2]